MLSVGVQNAVALNVVINVSDAIKKIVDIRQQVFAWFIK